MSTLKILRSAARQKRKTSSRAERAMAIVGKISSRRISSPFITRHDLDAAHGPASGQEEAQLREARARVMALLASPRMSPEALRERAERGRQWEETHGVIGAFVGKLK